MYSKNLYLSNNQLGIKLAKPPDFVRVFFFNKKVPLHAMKAYLLTYLLHGAESFLRS